MPGGAIYSRAILALFDLLVIGGGGLLAHPHDPLGDESWCERLPVPVVIMAVGAEGDFVSRASRLLKQAAFVSVRDVESLSWVLPHRSQIAIVPDPVLLAEQLPEELERRAKEYKRCWILRDPIDDQLRSVRGLVGADDIVVGVEPETDQKLLELFPKMHLVKSLDEFWPLVSASETIISMRYHGVILGLIAGIDTYAYRVSKGAALLRLLGLGNKIITEVESFTPNALIDGAAFETQRKELAALYVKFMRANLSNAVRAGSENLNSKDRWVFA